MKNYPLAIETVPNRSQFESLRNVSPNQFQYVELSRSNVVMLLHSQALPLKYRLPTDIILHCVAPYFEIKPNAQKELLGSDLRGIWMGKTKFVNQSLTRRINCDIVVHYVLQHMIWQLADHRYSLGLNEYRVDMTLHQLPKIDSLERDIKAALTFGDHPRPCMHLLPMHHDWLIHGFFKEGLLEQWHASNTIIFQFVPRIAQHQQSLQQILTQTVGFFAKLYPMLVAVGTAQYQTWQGIAPDCFLICFRRS
jgi:hypothetical protein